MAGEPGSDGRASRVLAAVLFGLAMSAVATAVAVELAGGFPVARAVDSFTVTDAAMGVAFPVCGVLLGRRPSMTSA